ncbi:uncharacterized protein [Nicotiana tomentosiformis]|uniref:uncharacterized protein n=1 Tax=Nicotiana tomentosiformis TaxID=4098 RepID=UPI00388CB58E
MVNVVDESTSANSSVSFIPDHPSPFFLLSSDVPGVSLANTPFSVTRFGGWRRNMIVSLSARNKIGFIDGTVFEIKQELASTNQGSLEIASYFNKLKKPWDELGFMRASRGSSCTCAAKYELQREDDENKLHQFLMGLNESYVGVRSDLLMMQPPPSLDTAYNILLQDERQRQVSSSSHFRTDSASFNDHLTNKFAGTPAPSKQFTQRVNFEYNNSNLVCRYCKKPGNLVKKCYKLHGFPPGFKFTKSKRTAANVEVQGHQNSASHHNSVEGSHSPAEGSSDSESLIPGITTPDQPHGMC